MSRVITPFDELRWQQQVEDRLDRLERRLTEQVWYVVGQFGAPIFTNNWANYGATFNPAGFMKDANGFVHLRGMVISGTIGQSIFTLPIGFRPANSELMVTMSNQAICRIDISPQGLIIPTVGVNTWLTLDNLSFYASN